MSIYDKISKNEIYKKVTTKIVDAKKEMDKKRRVKGKYVFLDRKKDSKTVCIILAGYKQFLWEDVFGRLEKFAPKDIDFCIVSSGLYSEELAKIAKRNDWSYLSVKQNKVTLVQNIAIKLHPKAEMIYKIDEDIFITENFFTQLKATYNEVEKNGRYNIGFVSPLLPINGYANVNYLKKTGMLEKYEEKFEKAYHDGDFKAEIVKNPEIAKFMWGETEEKLRDIDSISKEFSKQEFSYSVSPIRFSIGAILLSRDLWESMGRFKVIRGTNMGEDEIQICKYCMLESKAIVISENTVAGHFSYGPQTNTMKEFYESHRDIFKIK